MPALPSLLRTGRGGRLSRLSILLAIIVAILGGAAAVDAAGAQSAPGGRLALVVANTAYPDRRLKTPLADARAIADALRRQGFSVMVADNQPRAALAQSIASFRQRIEPGTVAVFYYSGYALQAARKNYLLPVDAAPGSASEVASLGIGLDTIFDKLAPGPGGARIAILEASRLNPLEQSFRGFSSGLAAVEAPEGGLVAFSAAPGKVAPEPTGDLDGFTREAAAALSAPAPLADSLAKLRDTVATATRNAQTPFIASRLPRDLALGSSPAPAAEAGGQDQ